MTTFKIKVGTHTLTATRDVELPQQFAAWHQTVRVEPDTYPVYAYVEWGDGRLHVRQLSAECEGVTVSSNYRSHLAGHWGKDDRNVNGQVVTCHIQLPTYGVLREQPAEYQGLRVAVWDPKQYSAKPLVEGTMWRYEVVEGLRVRVLPENDSGCAKRAELH